MDEMVGSGSGYTAFCRRYGHVFVLFLFLFPGRLFRVEAGNLGAAWCVCFGSWGLCCVTVYGMCLLGGVMYGAGSVLCYFVGGWEGKLSGAGSRDVGNWESRLGLGCLFYAVVIGWLAGIEEGVFVFVGLT
ncbi:hypothetical protein B0J18DRAFT_51494 [Chaetomium sp. MPI-SDFR-AT-0129]|nr:hypothetical protein B0J18DRAFT_51494 [Chaetomium sp. MPI-SDFR-AT-0129]